MAGRLIPLKSAYTTKSVKSIAKFTPESMGTINPGLVTPMPHVDHYLGPG